MIAIIPTSQSQLLRPVPAIGQNIEFTGDGQAQTMKDPFRQGDFRLEAAASLGPFRMVEAGRQGQESLFIEERRQDPLVAKDIRQVLSMILIPSAAGDLLSCFFDNRIIQEEKDDGAGFNLEGMEEFCEGHGQDFIPGPGIFPQETGEAGERAGKKRASQRLDRGGGVNFFPQLDETNNEGRKELERGA